MARKFEFTRTLETTKAIALVFNKTSGEAENVPVRISGKYDINDRKLAKRVQKEVETDDNLKFIEVVDVEVETALYGTTLEQFMSIATPLNLDTRQPFAE